MKKFISVLLTLVMALSLVSVSAFATTLTINEPDGMKNAEYAGYKILNATNNADDTTKFAYTLNDKYTTILQEVTGKTKEADIVAYIASLTAASDMKAFVDAVYAKIKAADPAITADATLETGANDVAEGYWLIAQTSKPGELETSSLIMVDTAGKASLTIDAKKSTFTVDKKVTDESQLNCTKDHQHTAACYNWTETNESPIGATVQYKIETQVPATMADYTYNAYFIVGDKLGRGLDLKANTIKVYAGDTQLTADKYTVRTATTSPACEEGYTFQVALVNPKDYAGQNITVYYDAVVNEHAELTITGNPNEADVTYNPTDDVNYGGEPGNGFPTQEQSKPTGKTPKDFTITYVTGLKFLKVDEKGGKLNGAEFTITGITESTELKWEQKYTKVADGTGEYYLLADKKSYTTQAPVQADYMKAIESETYVGGYVVAADTDETAAKDVTISNVRYRVATEADFEGGKTIYTLVKANADKYAERTPNYDYSEGWEPQTATKAYNEVIKVDENGVAKLPGLAAGTYHVTESVVPQGYNKIDDFDIIITWTAPTAEELAKGTAAKCTWTAKVGDTTLTLDETNTYLYKLVVENNAGTELPSTGGVGTTLFYVFGGILVMAVAVLFVTKKRLGIEK